MNTIELIKRKKQGMKIYNFYNKEIGEILDTSIDSELAAKEFNRIFSDLLKLVKESTYKNDFETQVDSSRNNKILILLNKLKNKISSSKEINQLFLFKNICDFINDLLMDNRLGKVHNTIPKTSLSEFSQKTIGNQLFQNVYIRDRGSEGIGEGGSCSYWAVLLYNFFNKLKEAGLDIKISFFRYKKMDDDNVSFHTNRHSGLIINFQGEDYMVDLDGALYDNTKTIVRELQSYIDKSIQDNKPKDAQFFENFRYENKKETSSVIFFDDIDSFIKYCKNHPENYKISFYLNKPVEEDEKYVDFEFGDISFCLGVIEYYLTDNDLHMNNLIKNIIKKISIKRIGKKYMPVTDQDKEEIKKSFALIKNMIDMNKLHENFTSGGKLKTKIIKDKDGNPCEVKIYR